MKSEKKQSRITEVFDGILFKLSALEGYLEKYEHEIGGDGGDPSETIAFMTNGRLDLRLPLTKEFREYYTARYGKDDFKFYEACHKKQEAVDHVEELDAFLEEYSERQESKEPVTEEVVS